MIDWDRAAAVYARQERWEIRAIDAALDLAAAGPGDDVLDAGTGTALALRRLAARAVTPASVLGVDTSAGMLARAGALPPGWRLRRADAADLPLDDGSVDIAVAAYLLHVAADPQAVLAELRRVLRPGGRLVTVTPWSPRAAGRALLRAGSTLPWLAGLRPEGPRDAPGLAPERARFVRGGYPSLVVCFSAG